MMVARLVPEHKKRIERLDTLEGEALERLVAGLALGRAHGLVTLLASYSKFRQFGIRNSLLICAQLPGATRVASSDAWNRRGFRVAPGAQAIWIHRPSLGRGEDHGTPREHRAGGRPAPVFDTSHLEPESRARVPNACQRFPDDAAALWEDLVHQCTARSYRIVEVRLPEGHPGSCNPTGRIAIDERQDPRSKILTLAHELAHHCGHFGEVRKDLTPADMELQAEATSVAVGAMLGLEHPSARDYLLAWHGTRDKLRRHCQAIQRLVGRVIDILALEEFAA
jgi:hypothetical protein